MKSTAAAIVIAAALVGGAILATRSGSSDGAGAGSLAADNVKVVDGVQIIEIRAHGGYQPRKSVAKAGLPTIVRFDASGTFDCSASVRIPALGISKFLSQSGDTDISLGTSTAGVIRGSCGMGMYPFELDFQG